MLSENVERSTIAATQPRIGERLGPAREAFPARDRHAGGFLPLDENLDEQLGAAPAERHVAQFVDAEKIHPALPGNRVGQLALIGGLDETVDQLGRQALADQPRGDP
jgi:hypothetical protein